MTLGAHDLGDRIASASELRRCAARGFDGGTNALRAYPESLGEFVDCRPPSGVHGASHQLAEPGYADTGFLGQQLDGPATPVKDGLPQVPKGLGHAAHVAESDGKDNPPLDTSGGKCDKVKRQEREPVVIRQDFDGLAGSEPERNRTMSNLPEPTAAPQPSAAVCRHCEEPTSLQELRDLDGLCTDCESEQSERLRQDAWDSHFEDMAEWREADRAEGFR